MNLVELKQEPQKLTAALSGELDHHHAKEIRETVDFAVREQLPPTLVLDFTKVTFMDSSGIGLMYLRVSQRSLGAFRRVQKNAVRIVLPRHGLRPQAEASARKPIEEDL